MTKVDINKAIERATTKTPRQKVSFSLDGAIYESFRAACERKGVSMSRLIEELMIEATEALNVNSRGTNKR